MNTQFNRALTLFHPDSIAVQKSGVILVLEREKYFFPAKRQSSKLVKLHFSSSSLWVIYFACEL